MSDMTALAKLREPFKSNQISKLPKPTKAQTDAVRADFKKGIRCGACGAWHHPDVIHLDYVGHAALTDRLLDVDPAWSWEPLAISPEGLPVLDPFGGMWIKLTVCGVTRLGYGHAGDKSGGDAIKEIIGDALRNAAMRFGAALDLWHKGDLHADEEAQDKPERKRTGVAQDVLDTTPALPEKRMHELADLAVQVKDDFSVYGAQAAFERIEEHGLDNVEKIYLSTLLPSDVRNPIKKYSQDLRASKKATA